MARTVTLGAPTGGGYAAPSPAPAGKGRRVGRSYGHPGDAFYLWLLLGLELLATAGLRQWSRNHHGG